MFSKAVQHRQAAIENELRLNCAHSYKPSPNRTLQRRRQLLQNLNKDYMRDRPQTAESIHHTSVASDNTDARDQEELDYLLLASAGLDEHEAQVFGIPPNSLASFGDATSHQIGHLTGREIAEFAIDSSFSSNNVSARDQRPDKVEEVGSEEDPDIQEVAEAEKYFLEFDDDAKRSSDITTNTPVNSSSLHRPMSMHDTGLRKSVRFADATNGRTDIHKGRSRSAMPCFRQDRIPNPRHSEVAQNTKQKGRSSCRPSSTEVMNSWHDDTGHDPGSGDGTHRSGAWSVNSVMSSNSTNTNQTAPPKKSSGGGNTEKSEVLCTSIGEVKFDSDEVCTSADRPPSQMTMRLRPRLGEWEDIIKPEDCGNLVISGKSKDMTERETDVRSMPFKRAGCTTPRGKRPQSAKGPYEFITEEKRQMVLKARPVSARAECPGLDSSVSTMSAVLNVRPQSGRKPSVISPRPQSARNKSVAKTAAVISSKCLRPSSGRFKKSNSAKQQKTKRHHGQEVREDRSGSKPCSYCGQPTDKDINYENGSYFIVCRNCSHQSCNMEVANDTRVAVPDDDECWDLNVNEVAKCLATEMLQRKGQELESGSTNDNTVITSGSYQGMQYGRQGNHGSQVIYSVRDQADSVNTEPSNPVDCPANEVTGDPESNTISSSQKEALKEEGQILSNLDLLEKSLADVQTEIKDCLRQTRSFDDDDDDDKNDVPDDSDVKSSSASKIIEPEPSRNGDVSQQLCEGGFSSKLVGDIDHHWEAVEDNIKVYQFVEKDTDMKKQDGSVMRNMNNNISSYEATMVSPLKPGNSTQATEQAFSVQLQEPMSGGQKEGSSVDNSVSPLSTYIHRHITERFWGLLFGFKLLFNKKGVDEEAGGFPNIELCDHSSVEGCLQLITPAELNHLDQCFGYPEYCVPAVMYVARDRWTHRGDTPLDSSYASDQCLKGTTFLSPEYTKQLQQNRDLN
ncbi:hypothetical protein LSH36_834g02060 [Paralvinella palmiformis]|uniref:Uncharacterized protein n=1 Tax=Paralvinella palmiformis TaxID=53620 RepID=A0AAD9MTR3_9ANNE|nr:hypothetical protein LSH36_834g02060 [Paralvinella palmiformis]